MMQSLKGKNVEEETEVSKRMNDYRGYGPKEKPRHLYIVLDDWSRGYSINKIDLSSGDPGEQMIHRVHSLPSAIFKFEAPRSYPRYIAAAFGSKILAMQPMDSKYAMDGFMMYDVHTSTFSTGPQQTPNRTNPIYIPVGDRLFALAAGSFQVLYLPSYDESDCRGFVWRWHTLAKPPFLHEHVTCYAVHSDERIYVTICGGSPATFSFDVINFVKKGMKKGRWKNHAQWNMPFKGRAYFVPELDICVGLCRGGHLIGAIDAIVSENVDGSQHDLALELCKEKLSCIFTGELPIGTTLVSMGGGSKFCLLQYTNTSEDEPSDSSTSKENEEQQDCGKVMRLITFSLKYDKNGGLTISKDPQILHYSVPSQVTSSMLETPVAFWM